MADSARTEAIRRSAARLFEVSGYASTTMSDIAAAVGVLPGSLYHHFASKEQIAVDLLTAFHRALDAAATAAGHERSTPEARVRALAAEVAAVSFAHAAAVRLRAFEPPSVATEQLRTALQLRSPALQRAWRAAVGALRPVRPVDLGLLRFALEQASLEAAATFPAAADPAALAGRLCDAFLDGLAADGPSDAELDGSAAARVARDAVAGWRSPGPGPHPTDRDLIVAAARAQFARRGYAATTIRDVADAAGVRMGTLYRRVDSKESLLREILQPFSDATGGAIDASLSAGSSAVAALDALARVLIAANRRFAAESCIVRYGAVGRESSGSPFHDYHRQTQARLERLRATIDDGRVAGELRGIDDVGETAHLVRSVLWLPFARHARTGRTRAQVFVRATLLRGALRGPG